MFFYWRGIAKCFINSWGQQWLQPMAKRNGWINYQARLSRIKAEPLSDGWNLALHRCHNKTSWAMKKISSICSFVERGKQGKDLLELSEVIRHKCSVQSAVCLILSDRGQWGVVKEKQPVFRYDKALYQWGMVRDRGTTIAQLRRDNANEISFRENIARGQLHLLFVDNPTVTAWLRRRTGTTDKALLEKKMYVMWSSDRG